MRHTKTVLLVEDSPDLRDAIECYLTRLGYRVTAASCGAEATRLLADWLPDLAVVDMMLPGASGFQLARLVKERSDGKVPVAMMSGCTSAAHRDYAHALGIDVFLPKPFPLALLARAAEALCPLVRPPAPSDSDVFGHALMRA